MGDTGTRTQTDREKLEASDLDANQRQFVLGVWDREAEKSASEKRQGRRTSIIRFSIGSFIVVGLFILMLIGMDNIVGKILSGVISFQLIVISIAFMTVCFWLYWMWRKMRAEPEYYAPRLVKIMVAKGMFMDYYINKEQLTIKFLLLVLVWVALLVNGMNFTLGCYTPALLMYTLYILTYRRLIKFIMNRVSTSSVDQRGRNINLWLH
ncbi:TPA: hypothetical protein DF272_00320 [Candidatus Falkowbacteria bacterium]|nr:hypothetical protein [Candidatus Falkowbacteria bacterium]